MTTEKTAEQWELEALRAREEARACRELVLLIAQIWNDGYATTPGTTLEEARERIATMATVHGRDPRAVAALKAWKR